MSSSSSDQESDHQDSDRGVEQRNEIREDLQTMSFEEIMKLKDELGSKLYNEAVLGVDNNRKQTRANKSSDLKRLNKNRPRELPTTRQVPFLGAELRSQRKSDSLIRDPRFDERSGEYDAKNFKENYKFLSKIRQREVRALRKELDTTSGEEERSKIKQEMQRLINTNVEEQNWRMKQSVLREEQQEIQQAHAEGRQPHYTTKKERRAKELVKQFETLKKSGKLNKHLEKRRKKNAAKDRKKLGFD